jgi:protein O-GlcNAc transferase
MKKKKIPKRFAKNVSGGKKRSAVAATNAIEKALVLHRQGNLAEAEVLYQEALESDPDNVDALHLIGLIMINRGENEGGLALVNMAVARVKDFPQMHNTLGIGYRNIGDWSKSESSFKKAIKINPSFIDAWAGLALLYRMEGKFDQAVVVCRDALKIAPNNLMMLIECGATYQSQKNFEEAEKYFEKVISIDQQNTCALNNLGVMNIEWGRAAKAAEYLSRILAYDPNYAFGWNNLGLAYRELGQHEEAMKAHERAVEIDPMYLDARYNIGRLNMFLGRIEIGKQIMLKLTEDFPLSYMAFTALGDIFLQVNDFENAERFYSQATKVSPGEENFYSFSNLAVIYRELQRFDDAEKMARGAIRMDPHNSETYNTLGWILHDMGRHHEAEEVFRAGLVIKPDSMKIHSNLLFLLTYQMNLPHDRHLAEHIQFGKRHQPKDKENLVGASNEMLPYRCLRIGYISPDFKRHVVRNFIQPVIKAHNRSRVEVYCYGEIEKPDGITAEIKRNADHWRSTVGLSDLVVANQIRNDKIDVLIDLAGHSGGNRLGVLMYKPAPVQVEYLGYISTTGVPEIDYRVTDHIMNPLDTKELHSEKLYRLDRCYKVYEPAPNEPDINLNISPADRIIFGSLNRISKLPDSCIELWCDVLKSVEGSKLLLARHELKFLENKKKVISLFEKFGIGEDRLILDDTYGYKTHMEIYNKIDIALDPVPVSGGATTCEALWMGVPVLTLQGEPFRGRISSTLLTAIGLSDWVTTTRKEFVGKAQKFTKDYDYRLELRKKQRELMKNSELGDAVGLATALEDAYIEMWNAHLAKNI